MVTRVSPHPSSSEMGESAPHQELEEEAVDLSKAMLDDQVCAGRTHDLRPAWPWRPQSQTTADSEADEQGPEGDTRSHSPPIRRWVWHLSGHQRAERPALAVVGTYAGHTTLGGRLLFHSLEHQPAHPQSLGDAPLPIQVVLFDQQS